MAAMLHTPLLLPLLHSTCMGAGMHSHGIGWMTGEQWRETARVLAEQGVLNKPVDIDQAYDTSFLESADPPRR